MVVEGRKVSHDQILEWCKLKQLEETGSDQFEKLTARLLKSGHLYRDDTGEAILSKLGYHAKTGTEPGKIIAPWLELENEEVHASGTSLAFFRGGLVIESAPWGRNYLVFDPAGGIVLYQDIVDARDNRPRIGTESSKHSAYERGYSPRDRDYRYTKRFDSVHKARKACDQYLINGQWHSTLPISEVHYVGRPWLEALMKSELKKEKIEQVKT